MKKFNMGILCLLLSVPLSAQFFIGENTSIFSDVKAHGIGDVLTVYVMESANATRESQMDNSSKTDAGASSGISGNLTGFLPVFGASTNIASSQAGSEGTKQNDKLTGKISAVITGVRENGLFEIEGQRLLEVNGEKNIMRITGLVRSRDIEDDNVVYSYKIANASIQYSKGDENNQIEKHRPGFAKRITAWSIIGVSVLLGIFTTGAL